MHASMIRGCRRLVRLLPVLGAALVLTTTGAVHAAGGWDATLSRALADAPAAALMKPVAPDMPMQITLTLKLSDKAALDALFQAQNTPGSAQYQQFLTPRQFAAQFAPTPAQTQAVADYLTASGFTNVRNSASGLLVGGTATAAQVQSAFNTQIAQFSLGGRTVYVNTQAAQVPSSLGGVVLAVGGLQNAINMKAAPQQKPSGTEAALPNIAGLAAAVVLKQDSEGCLPNCTPADGGVFTPVLFPLTYDAGSVPQASNTAIAISTYGDDLSADEGSTVLEDLRNAEASYGMPYVPVEVRLATPIAKADIDTSGDDEWDLDTQYSTGMAGNVRALVIYADDDSVVDNLLWEYAAFADAADAKVGNMSYGLCELFEDATLTTNPLGEIIFGLGVVGGLPTLQSSDQFFEQAAVEGLSWHAATGDSGGYCTVGNIDTIPGTGIPGGANYPASSPYVTAVGGTSLITDSSFDYLAEFSWESGGGGVSVVEAPPSWQSGIVPSADLSVAGIGRGVPDIAMFAGTDIPEVIAPWGAELYVAGSADEAGEVFIGTSLASPLAVGSWARFQSSHCNALGFAPPDYYALAGTHLPLLSSATGFNDIILGSNLFYTALPGWDYTSGFGSIDISSVAAALNTEIPVPATCAPLPAAPAVSGVDSNTNAANASASIEVFPVAGGDPVSYYVVDFGDGVPGAVGTGISSTLTQAPNPDVGVQPTVPWPNQTCASSPGGAAPNPPPGGSGGGSTCLAPFTGNPALFTHSYPKSGTYTARAWARNAHGVVSQPVSFTVTAGTPSAPIRPTALLARAVNGTVQLAWTAGPGASSYDVYAGTAAGGESAKPIVSGITGTSAVIHGLSGGSTYYFVVKAVNASGTSAASNEASAELPLTPPPAPPGKLTATAGTGSVTLNWTAGTGATSYRIYQGTASGAESKAYAKIVTVTTATITGLTPGTRYYFLVQSVNYAGSALSSEVSATPN